MDRFVNIIDGWPSPPQPTIVGMQYQDFVKTASFLGYQATKQPRTTTPNTSPKMPTNSLQITAVNPIKNHIAEQPDDESQEFAPERVVPMSWNQVTIFVWLAKQWLTHPASFRKIAST